MKDNRTMGRMPSNSRAASWRAFLLRSTLALVILPGAVMADPASPPDLTQASLDELMNIPVTSVSKKEESLSKAGSAIYVITQDDIRRSGATNIPDLLRMVPGVDVARVNASAWAISIRGFNSRYSGQVLVLIDGRSVYTPLFSGVFWDQQNIPLEDIERIEVTRGPGGTVWGANAMNGVIDIITKDSKNTRGGLLTAVTGSYDRAQGLAQYGGAAGASGSWRIYGRYTMNENSPSLTGDPAVDEGHDSQVGFRSDWDLSPRDKLTVQGDASGASEGETVTTLFSNRLPNLYTFGDQVRFGAEDILGRWNHVFADGSETTVQMYYDHFRRIDEAVDTVSTGDVDFQYHFHPGARHDVVTGIGYRVTDLQLTDGYELTLGQGQRRDNLVSGFIQDKISLTNSLALTLGSKFEHNAYTGFEYEPGVQLAWSPTNRQTVWASVSRAIEQPSWVYEGIQVNQALIPLPGGGTGIYTISGNPRIKAPDLLNFEIGYRTEISRSVTFDTSIFAGRYGRLVTVEPQAPYLSSSTTPPLLFFPNIFQNLGKALNYGGEMSVHWDAAKWWRITPGFSFLQMDLALDPRSNNPTFLAGFGDSPRIQAQLRSNINLPHHLEWDTSVFYVGRLNTGPVPAYTRVDTRLGWHIGEFTEVSLAGQNLLTPRHAEFLDSYQVVPVETPRTVLARVAWRF